MYLYEIFQENLESEISTEQAQNKFFNYLEQNPEGIYLVDLFIINKFIEHYINDFEDNIDFYKKCIVLFFKSAKMGFIKQKNFDDKLNFNEMVKLLQIICALAHKLDHQLKNESLQTALIEINYFSLNFFYHFMTNEELMKIDYRVLYEEVKDKDKIEYFSTKLTINKKPCEVIKFSEDFFNIKNKSKIKNSISQTKYAQEVFNESHIIPDLIEFIQKNHQVYQDFVILILEIFNFTYQNQSIIKKACSLGFLRDIIYIIYDNKDDYKNYISRLSFEILWNYIYLLGKEAIQTIETEYIIFIVKEMLCCVIHNGYKLEDKIIRNELLVLVNYLLNSKEVLKSVMKEEMQGLLEKMHKINLKEENLEKYSLLEILIFLCTTDESIEFRDLKKQECRKYFEIEYEDLMCKKLIIHTITVSIKNSNQNFLEKLLSKSYFIETLFYYFELYNGDQLQNNSRYSIPQIKEIQEECLNALEVVAGSFQQVFFEKERIILFLKYLRNSKDNNKLYSILKVFEKLSNQNNSYNQKIVEKGTIDLLLYYINGCERMKNLEDEEILKIKTSTFNILANLCFQSKNNQFIFAQKGGIETILINLKNHHIMKTERCSLYTINIFKTLRNCIIGNEKNEEVFLENEGFYLLLEFLEECLDIHYKQLFSIISSLLENPNAIRFFEDWNSSTSSYNSVQLLIKIYIEQDQKFKVQYEKGVLINVQKPLNPKRDIGSTKKAFKQLKHALNQDDFQNIEEFIQNMNAENFNFESFLVHFLKASIKKFDLRDQIYCILNKTGFDREILTIEEQQRLEIIKNYKQL